jgi:hypothetical protein
MKKTIVNKVSDYLGIENKDLLEIVNLAPSSYKKYSIPKKNNNGTRTIYHPSKSTKMIQYSLIQLLLSKIVINRCAVGYVNKNELQIEHVFNSPLRNNASLHSKYKYNIKIDFEDFFPSICEKDLISTLQKEEEFSNLSEEEFNFITKALFLKKHDKYVLAIGAPSSPIVSNIIMKYIDQELEKLSQNIDPQSTYTRYADDITFSSNIKGTCKIFYDEMDKLIQSIASPKLKVNKSKTVFLSRAIKRRITGLVICPNGELSIGRRNLRYIKKLLCDFKYGIISEEDRKYLKGYLSFLMDVCPEQYNNLIMKYKGQVVLSARLKNQIITKAPDAEQLLIDNK